MQTDIAESTGEIVRAGDLPPTDVVAVMRALLARGPAAALPQNLPDTWLRLLLRDMLATQSPGGHDHLAVKMLVVALLSAQKRALPLAGVWNFESLFESEPFDSWLHNYHLALIGECVERQVGAGPKEYTIENVFDRS